MLLTVLTPERLQFTADGLFTVGTKLIPSVSLVD